MRADQAEFLLWFLLPQLKSEQTITTKIIAAVPPNKDEYKPEAKSKSAFELSRHIAVCEVWFLDAVIHRHFAQIAVMPEQVKNCRDVAQWYEENSALRLPLLECLSGDDLASPVDFIGLRNDPAVSYLNIAIRHSVHHRGQLSTYLRPMGAKVPAIYVESADEPYDSEPGPNAVEGQRPPAF